MRLTSDLYFLLLVDLAACFLLSYFGVWYLAFIPSVLIGSLLKSRWLHLISFGFSGAIGAILPIFISDATARLDSGAVLAAVLGLPGGFVGPLILTAMVAFFISGLAAVVASSFRDTSPEPVAIKPKQKV
jgi:hypothetical protein